jgi:phosphatidylserine/phosphatidylglycerophosphate/cardiolipin synthase-like enzyme
LNDETLIVIDNPTVAAHYEQEFNRLYGTAVLGLDSLPQSHQCGSDSLRSPKQPITSTESESIFSDN